MGTPVYKTGGDCHQTPNCDNDTHPNIHAPTVQNPYSMSDPCDLTLVFCEATGRKLVADVARTTLAHISTHLEAAPRAEEVLRRATGDAYQPYPARAADHDHPMDAFSKLFSLAYHVLAPLRRMEPAFASMPELWSAVEDLRSSYLQQASDHVD